MKKFTEIREARRSAQDRLSARASKHGLGSQKRLDKIKKSADFFSKPPPSFSKDELKKMGYAVEGKKFKDVKNLKPDELRTKNRKKVLGGTSDLDDRLSKIKRGSKNEAYYRGQRKATPKKQEPPKMGSKSDSGYDLYHKSYSGALQHAYAWAKKKGYTVDPDDIDSKVASGPKKPSEGRTNSFTLKLKDNPKKMLAVQVYGMGGGKYELNTYIT